MTNRPVASETEGAPLSAPAHAPLTAAPMRVAPLTAATSGGPTRGAAPPPRSWRLALLTGVSGVVAWAGSAALVVASVVVPFAGWFRARGMNVEIKGPGTVTEGVGVAVAGLFTVACAWWIYRALQRRDRRGLIAVMISWGIGWLQDVLKTGVGVGNVLWALLVGWFLLSLWDEVE